MNRISDRIEVFEIPLSEMQAPGFRDAYAVWNDLPKAAHDLPQWPGIDFLLAVPSELVRDAMIMDYGGSIETSQYLFWGSGLRWASDTDMTGKSPVEFASPDLTDYIAWTLMPAIENKKPYYYEAEFIRADGHRSPEQVLRLPFVDDSDEIDCVLSFTSLRDPEALGNLFAPTPGTRSAR